MSNLDAIKKILSYSKKSKWTIFYAFFASIVFALTTLLIPVITGEIVDLFLVKESINFDRLGYYLLLLVLTIMVLGVSGYLTGLGANILAFSTSNRIRLESLRKINTLPIKTIDVSNVGDLMQRGTTDIEFISEGLIHLFTEVISGLTMIIGTIIIMYFINVWLATVVVVLTPLSFLMSVIIAKRCKSSFRKKSDAYGEMATFSEEIISNMSDVNNFDVKDRLSTKFNAINENLRKVGVKAHFNAAIINPCTRVVNNLVYAFVGLVGAILAIKGEGVTAGILTTFLLYASQYSKPFNSISTVVSELQMGLSSSKRVFDLLEKHSEEIEINKIQNINAKGDIEFKNVAFGYDKPLFENLSFKVNSGDRVAIVGKTGSGKTTIVNLIMRYYEVTKGNILLDGIDIRDIDRDALRDKIAIVTQDSWLSDSSLFDNLTYGNKYARMEDVVNASKKCNIHSFISRLKDGYYTKVSDINLSVGQKQLVCIARAMLKDSDILVLDEATSNIDTRTELYVQKAFYELMKGKTSFCIAHRLSTIVSSDLILVVDSGKIVEMGKHQELLDKKGYYYRLYNREDSQE